MEESRQPTFGELLRQFRLEAGLSQEALAERSRMGTDSIGALERGARRSPYRESVTLLAQALRLSDDDRAKLEQAASRPRGPRRRHLVAAPTEGTLPFHVLDSADIVTPAPLHNLPWEVSSLVGREHVTLAVSELVRGYRLVTLTGSGGIGKTRVALRAAGDLIGVWPDGVWFVELAHLSQSSFVVGAVAQVLGVKESLQRSPLESLVASLRVKKLLLLLDNCEHVIDAARVITAAIVRRCPGVRILVTSREPLNVGGERSYQIPSLSHPEELNLTASAAQEYSAVRLFTDRAQAADVNFAIDDANAPAVSEVCRRLDGIPLAIELAAARIKVLGPHRMLRRLDERFRILNSGDRTVMPRLQTMRAAIDWSFALLSKEELVLTRRLAIFAAGWTLEAAEDVCSDELISADRIFELLGSLVDKSLVTAKSSREEERYQFLESIRAYALEKLDASGERTDVARRHAKWAADYGERLAEQLFYAEGIWDENVALEGANRREALNWALGTTGDPFLAGRIAGSVPFVNTIGHEWAVSDADACALVETALARTEKGQYPIIEARLWLALGAVTRGERSLVALRKSIALFELLGEREHWFGHGLRGLEICYKHTGRFEEALAANDRRLDLIRALAAKGSWFYRKTLELRAQHLKELKRYDESRQCLIETIALSESPGQRHSTKVVLAELEFEIGNVRQAATIADEAAARYPLESDTGGTRWELSTNRCNAAAYRLALGELDEARLRALKGLELAGGGRVMQASRRRTWATQHLATIAALRGDVSNAGRLRGYVDAWYANEGEVRELTEQRTYELLDTALKKRLSETDIERLAAEGALLGEDEAIKMAVAAV